MKSKQISLLKDIAEIIMGQSPPGSSYNESGDGLPFYQGVTDFGFRYPIKREFCNEPKKMAKLDDILISVRAPIGSINIASEKCAIGRGIAIIRPYSKEDLLFLESFLKFKEKKWEHLESVGTIFGNAKRDDLENLELFWPEKNLRMFIGDLFNNVTTKIQNLQNQNKILEQIIQSVFKSWFIDFDGVTEFEDSELGKIPKGWKADKLESMCDIFSGGTPSTTKDEYWNGDIFWLSSGETRNHFIVDTERKITQLGVDNSSTRLAKKFDIVIASAGQGNTRGQTSLCFINTYINQSVVALRSKDNYLYSFFLFCNLKSRYDELRNISDSHSSRGSLPKNLLITLELVMPDEKILKKFNDVVNPLFENIQKNYCNIDCLIKIRDSLLPKLMSGEIRV